MGRTHASWHSVPWLPFLQNRAGIRSLFRGFYNPCDRSSETSKTLVSEGSPYSTRGVQGRSILILSMTQQQWVLSKSTIFSWLVPRYPKPSMQLRNDCPQSLSQRWNAWVSRCPWMTLKGSPKILEVLQVVLSIKIGTKPKHLPKNLPQPAAPSESVSPGQGAVGGQAATVDDENLLLGILGVMEAPHLRRRVFP